MIASVRSIRLHYQTGHAENLAAESFSGRLANGIDQHSHGANSCAKAIASVSPCPTANIAAWRENWPALAIS